MFKSITTRLFLLSLCASLVPLIALSYWGITYGYAALERGSLTVLSHVASFQAHEFERIHIDLQEAVREVRDEIDFRRISSSQASGATLLLNEYISLHQRKIRSILLYDIDGALLATGNCGADTDTAFPATEDAVVVSGRTGIHIRRVGSRDYWAIKAPIELPAPDPWSGTILIISPSPVGGASPALSNRISYDPDAIIGPALINSRRYIIDSTGRVLSAQVGPDVLAAPAGGHVPAQVPLAAVHSRQEMRAAYKLENGIDVYGVVYPDPLSGLYFTAEIDREKLDEGIRRMLLGVLVASFFALVATLATVFFLGKRITRPIRQLVKATADLSTRIDPTRAVTVHDGGDEVASLRTALDAMIATVNESQEALRDSEAKFIALVSQPVLGILFVNRERIIFANSALATILGREPEEIGLSAQDFLSLILEEDRPFVCPDGLDRFVFSEKCWFRTIGADGGLRWVNLVTRPVELSGEPAYLMLCSDVTEQKHYEQKIREQKTYLENLIEAIADPFYVIDAESRQVVMANRAARDLQANPHVDTCFALNPCSTPCSLKNHLCPFELSKLTKLSSTVEQIHYDENGRKRYIEVHGHPVLDHNGAVVQVIEYQLDITSRKRAENALRESEQRYSSLFENNHSVMLIIDPETLRIVDANPAACRFYGYAHDQITGMAISEINQSPSEDLDVALQLARESRRNHFQFDHRLATGEVRHVESFTGPIRLAGKDLLYSIVHDVSKRVEMERELKRRYESETLAASLATRFINPLSEGLEREIMAALREIGEFTGVDRCHLVEFNSDATRISSAYQWSRDLEGIRPLELEGLELKQFGWLIQRLPMLEPIAISRIDDLPQEAMAEQEAMRHSGSRSILALPLASGGVSLGALVFYTLASERDWSASDALLMRITGELFVNVLIRRRYEEELARSRDRLKDLAAHIQDRIENERASIAREVHDELGQLLTALKFDISWLKNKVPQEYPALVDKSRIMGDIIDEAVRCVQRITAELRPVLLDDLGLAAAIEWLAREFSERTGITTHLGLDEVQAEGAMAITLFRITQEALTNVGRHSFATELDISLKHVSGGVRLSISDNGIGINEEQLSDPKSYGLMGIQERAGFLDGTATISGSKGAGTRIEVFIPVRKKRKTK